MSASHCQRQDPDNLVFRQRMRRLRAVCLLRRGSDLLPQKRENIAASASRTCFRSRTSATRIAGPTARTVADDAGVRRLRLRAEIVSVPAPHGPRSVHRRGRRERPIPARVERRPANPAGRDRAFEARLEVRHRAFEVARTADDRASPTCRSRLPARWPRSQASRQTPSGLRPFECFSASCVVPIRRRHGCEAGGGARADRAWWMATEMRCAA
jgi:hypothetical protein